MQARSVPSLSLHIVAPRSEGWRDRLADHLLRLSPESQHNRFLVSAAAPMLRRHAETTRPALLVEARIEGAVCGIAELHLHNGSSVEGEIALSVEDRWQSRGIGRLLFERAAQEGRRHGAEELSVYYLRANHAMRRISERAGFMRLPDSDPSVTHAQLLCPPSRLMRLWRSGARRLTLH